MKMPEKKLFRHEVLEAKTPSLLSGPTINLGSALQGFGILTACFALCLVLLLIFGTYERRERVPGYVAPTTGMVRINPPRMGMVTSLDVTDGQHVYAGQRLFTISSMRGTISGEDADAAQVAALEGERANISVRVAREVVIAESRSRDIRRRVSELQSQSQSILGQQRLARERVELSNRELARLDSLQKGGHVSVSVLDERRGDLLAAQKNVNALGREFERLQADIAALESELKMIPVHLEARRDELHARMLEVERMLAEAEVQREIVVQAPIAGRITSLVVFPGQSVTPTQAVMAILPDEGRMQAVLFIPSHAAGFIKPGQKVRLRYDAFPHQRFGMHSGVVDSVSRTMLNPNDEAGPLMLQTPAYRVTATLDDESMMAYGQAIPLTPDLTLQADVVRERMRIIEWIFDPLRAAVSAL